MSEQSPEPAAPVQAVSAMDQAHSPASGGAQSVLDEVRSMRAKLGAGADPFKVPVPGFDGALVLVNRWVPLRSLSKVAQNLTSIEQPMELRIAAAADTLQKTVTEILIRVPDGSGGVVFRSLNPSGVPIDFSDPSVATYVGQPEAKTGRENVESLFGNEYALINVADMVVSWLQDTSKAHEKQILGN